jgi:lipopolysaccharide export system permease protein
MLRLERYIFRTATVAFLVSLVTLTGIVWITGALKQISLLTSKGQTILVFLAITGLGLPYLVAVIAPVALFGSVLYCLNRLNGDSELIVMAASGAPPGLLARPFLALSGLAFAALMVLHNIFIPASFDAVDELTKRVHADFISNFARPGAFNQLEAGFIFHYRERGPDGSLRGVFIQDRRDPQQISTFISEVGNLVEKNDDVYLVLRKGSVQRPRGAGDSSLVTFDDYAIDLSQFLHRGEEGAKRPRNRDTLALLRFNANDPAEKPMEGEARAELYDRLTSPLYALLAGLVAFAALGEARTTRQNRGMAILAAIAVFAAVRIFGFADSLMLRGKGDAGPPLWTMIGAWGGPLAASALALDVIFSGPATRALAAFRARR